METHETLNLVEYGYDLLFRTWGPSLLRRLDVQLNGYEYLKTLDIGYYFYSGAYSDEILAVLDPNEKTIIHIHVFLFFFFYAPFFPSLLKA